MKRSVKTTPVCLITIKEGGDSGKIDGQDYYLDALNELERNLIGRLQRVMTVSLNPVEKFCILLFDMSDAKKKTSLPSKEDLVHMAWEMEKDFDFKISCTVEIKPDEEKK